MSSFLENMRIAKAIKPTAMNKLRTDSVEYNGKKFRIAIHYVPAINKLGVVYGAAMKGNKILVDDYYMSSRGGELKTFVILHEIGHIVNGHLSRKAHYKKLYRLLLNLKSGMSYKEANIALRDINEEYVADRYAYECDKESTVNALKYLADVTMQQEIVHRLAALGVEYRPVNPLASIFNNAHVVSVEQLEEM